MVLHKGRVRKPVIFGRKKSGAATKSEDDTLDMLLHYAKAGMEHAELSMIEQPDLFSPEERRAFEQNKNMLDNAPYLIENYKSKMTEYDALYKKMLSILKKCEDIVAFNSSNLFLKVVSDRTTCCVNQPKPRGSLRLPITTLLSRIILIRLVPRPVEC